MRTLHISWCDERGSQWNEPLHGGTGVSTAPRLKCDAEGRTLKLILRESDVGTRLTSEFHKGRMCFLFPKEFFFLLVSPSGQEPLQH